MKPLCPLSKEDIECKNHAEILKRLKKGEIVLHTYCKECRDKMRKKNNGMVY